MELTYKIQGGDGKEYGPVSLEQLKTWIREGRVDETSQVLRSDQSAWATAGGLPELGFASAPPAPAPARVHPTVQVRPGPMAASGPIAAMKVAAAARSGATWFYWIAGLSLINSVSALTGSQWGFFVGLGITQVFDGVASEIGGAGKLVAFVLDLAAAGVFVLFGVFAGKRHNWAFIAGMSLYALDGLIFLLAGSWLSVGFHAFVLFCIFAGFSANRKLSALQVG